MDGKNQVSSITEEIFSSLPFWEEMEETKTWYKIIIQILICQFKFNKYYM